MPPVKMINDPVHGTIRLEGPMVELASTPEMNRLSQIRQLGLAYLVFPGAHHTRFEHSLGAMHVAGLLGSSMCLDPKEVLLLRCAGMLHDLGHGPFSHTMENLFKDRLHKDHMELTRDIITGEASPWDLDWWDSDWKDLSRGRDIPTILEGADLSPKEVAALVCQEGRSGDGPQKVLGVEDGQAFFPSKLYLFQVIHSPLDADQLDFLLRDSHYSGVAYGIIDLDRIVATATLHHGEFMVHRRGISALEGMLVARSLMYSSVYFHKTARIAECMLCRAGDHLSDEALERVWGMTDGEVLRFIRDQGGLAGKIATMLRFRQLFKSALRIDSEAIAGNDEASLPLKTMTKDLWDERERRRTEKEIERKARVQEGTVIIDVPDPGLTLSEPRLKRTDIKVLGDRPALLSTISSLARALQRRPPVPWCLMVSCPAADREAVAKVVKKVLIDDRP